MNISELINFGSCMLKKSKIPSHLLDSEILLSKTLNKSREDILVNFDQNIKNKSVLEFKRYLKRRSLNEPVAYIIGEKEFWSKKFKVNKNTLIPRPETELLVEFLLKRFKGKKLSILDIGTGSGCIIISLLNNLKQSNGLGIDISKKAIITAKKNSSYHKLQNKLKFINKPLESIFNYKFDLIVSNPPYIKREELKNLSDDIKKYEPRIALDGGNDGLDLIRKVIYKSKNILKINGMLALEIGNGQIKKVSKILIDNKFRIISVIKDYKDNVRCLIANLN
tara:strand:- start:1942 stop:2781 length:840 start_codon:yes stop_codon:yes gene_type:complete